MSDGTTIDEEKLEEWFEKISDLTNVALAVSGGPDSMALLLLADRWRRSRLDAGRQAPDLTVLTVNHRLRPEAVDECRLVESRAKGLGYTSDTLNWNGPLPTTRIQETARKIRYQMLAGSCHMRGIKTVLTAHHLDDQAETFLMRLARGSSVDGLSAMARENNRYGIAIFRPLLDVTKADLLAELQRVGWDYVEDPGNEDLQYERVRLRNSESALKSLGLTSEMICLSASRLRRARLALEEARDKFLADNALISDYGSARVDQLALLDAPDEIAIRALSKVLRICGGSDEFPNMARLENLVVGLKDDFSKNRTLAGCRIIAKGDYWLIVREAGRIKEKTRTIVPGDCMFWDNRYIVCSDKHAPTDLSAGPLGEDVKLKDLIEEDILKKLPKESHASLLAFRRNDDIIAIPALDFWTEAARDAGLEAKLITSESGGGYI